jgi:hypothetical protein
MSLSSRIRASLAGTVVLTVIGFAACADSEPGPLAPDTPNRSATTEDASASQTLDDRWLALADSVPGFAGFHYDRSGQLVVKLAVDGARLATAASMLLHDFGIRQFVGEAGWRSEAVQYSFRELHEARAAIYEVLVDEAGVEWFDIDEVVNRVVVGVSTTAGLGAARSVSEAGPHSSRILFLTTGRDAQHQDLQDKVRPVVGGTRIELNNGDPSGEYEICTLGYNVIRNGSRGILTASHCTLDNFRHDNPTVYAYQSDRWFDNDLVASDDVDPNLFFRFSDAAFIYNDNNEITWYTWGVAQPLYSAVNESGPLDIWSQDSRFEVTERASDNYQFVGQTAEKVGQRTGWTRGEVDRTCVHHGTLLCQWHADLYSKPGDSGSPVGKTGLPAYDSLHLFVGDREWKAFGILWGGPDGNYQVTYYSTLDQIEFDLGSLDLW